MLKQMYKTKPMNRRRLLLILYILIISLNCQAQQNTQVIRGKIVDAISQTPLPGAMVVVQDSNPMLGTLTDAGGNFKLPDIKPG